jgi:sugar lactone lactonase YvrE
VRLATDGTTEALRVGEGLPRTPLYGARAVVAAPDGNGYLVADPGTYGLYRVDAQGNLSTLTTELDIPQGLARFDDESVLVADLRSGFGVLLRVTLDGQVTEFAEVDSPKGIAPDGDNFVVVSHGARAVFRVERSGRVSTLAAGPPFDFPHDIVGDGADGFVVTDGYAAALFRVSVDGAVSVLAQGPPLVNPQGIVRQADGSYVVVDPQAGSVFRVGADGAVTRIAAASDSRQ